MLRKPNRPYLVMAIEEAIPFLDLVEKSDPMRWNHRLRVNYKKYGASVWLNTDRWTASDPDYVRRYLQLWATLFPHNMAAVKVWTTLSLNGLGEPHIFTYIYGRISVVYQEYMDLVEEV